MPLKLVDLQRSEERELNRLCGMICNAVGPILGAEVSDESEVIRNLAQTFYRWRLATENGIKTGMYTMREDVQRAWSVNGVRIAREVRASLNQLVEGLPPSFVLSIEERLKSRGMSIEQLNAVLSAIDDEMEEVETSAEKSYEKWVASYGGNTKSPWAYLRLELDACLHDYVKKRYRRAHIIATVEAAVSLIDPTEIGLEKNRVNSFLRENGR